MLMGGLEAILKSLFAGTVALLFGIVFLLDLIGALDFVGGIKFARKMFGILDLLPSKIADLKTNQDAMRIRLVSVTHAVNDLKDALNTLPPPDTHLIILLAIQAHLKQLELSARQATPLQTPPSPTSHLRPHHLAFLQLLSRPRLSPDWSLWRLHLATLSLPSSPSLLLPHRIPHRLSPHRPFWRCRLSRLCR